MGKLGKVFRVYNADQTEWVDVLRLTDLHTQKSAVANVGEQDEYHELHWTNGRDEVSREYDIIDIPFPAGYDTTNPKVQLGAIRNMRMIHNGQEEFWQFRNEDANRNRKVSYIRVYSNPVAEPPTEGRDWDDYKNDIGPGTGDDYIDVPVYTDFRQYTNGIDRTFHFVNDDIITRFQPAGSSDIYHDPFQVIVNKSPALDSIDNVVIEMRFVYYSDPSFIPCAPPGLISGYFPASPYGAAGHTNVPGTTLVPGKRSTNGFLRLAFRGDTLDNTDFDVEGIPSGGSLPTTKVQTVEDFFLEYNNLSINELADNQYLEAELLDPPPTDQGLIDGGFVYKLLVKYWLSVPTSTGLSCDLNFAGTAYYENSIIDEHAYTLDVYGNSYRTVVGSIDMDFSGIRVHRRSTNTDYVPVALYTDPGFGHANGGSFVKVYCERVKKTTP